MQIPIPPPNHEWLKILVSTLAGLLAGLAAEPVKAAMQWRVNSRRMKRALVHDIIMLIIARGSVKSGMVTDADFWKAVEVPVFDQYWENSRDIFYANFELAIAAQRLKTVSLLRKGVCEGRITPTDASVKLDTVLDELRRTYAFNTGFSPRFFRKQSTQTSASPEGKSTPQGSGSLDGQ